MTTETSDPPVIVRGVNAPARSYAQILADAVEQWPDNEALVIAGRRWTYRELMRESTKYALGFEALGVTRGSFVGTLLPMSVEFFAVLFGVSLAGGTVVPYNSRYKTDELAYALGDSRPILTVTTDAVSDYVDLPALLASASATQQSEYPAERYSAGKVIVLGQSELPGSVSQHEFLAAVDPDLDLDAEATRLLTQPIAEYAAVIYTSGTTSRPRGALLEPRTLEHWSRCGRLWSITEKDRFWDPCPPFHITVFGPICWVIDNGATFIGDTYFEAGAGLRQIVEERATLLYPTYPPIMKALMTHADFASTDLGSVRAYLNVAPPDDLRASQAAIPHATQISLYGSTEGGPVTMHSVEDDDAFRIETNGRPTDHVQVRIFDPSTEAAALTDAPGEIQYLGPNTFTGYLGDPVKTAASISPEGWVRTGDLGRIDPNGVLHYLGRFNDMIKVGGENVAPPEVEEVLGTYPGVKLCQVVGVADERLVEAVAAFVEMLPGEPFDEIAMIEYCRERMARYKVPILIRSIKDWPMSATKIQRSRLREMIEGDRS